MRLTRALTGWSLHRDVDAAVRLRDRARQEHPWGRLGSPADIAPAALFYLPLSTPKAR